MSLARALELAAFLNRQAPDSALMRLVSHRFPGRAYCLDIGSGEGANCRELTFRGHQVTPIDRYHRYAPNVILADIRSGDFVPHSFDLVYDINTLCHVEDPPFEKIREWLKPEGIFFSICPTALAPRYIEEGKDFTRRIDEIGLRLMLQPCFKEIRIYWRSEPDFKGNQLESWIVEARP